MSKPIMYGNFTKKFLNELSLELSNKKVLEIYSGNGYLASELQKRGVNILPTTIFSGHDGHQEKIYTEVTELDAVSAVERYKDDYDVLLVSWPTVSEEMWKAAMTWGDDKDIIFIGEMPNLKYSWGMYPGCASDLFFESVDIIKDFNYYEPKNILDKACCVKSKIDYVNNYKNNQGMKL